MILAWYDNITYLKVFFMSYTEQVTEIKVAGLSIRIKVTTWGEEKMM